MPSNVSDSDDFTTTIQVPNDGEDATSASLLDTFVQGLSNRTKWLYNAIKAWRDGGTITPSGSVTIAQALTVTGNLTSSGTDDVTVGDDLTVGDNATINGTLTVAEQIRGQIRFNITTGPNSNQTYAVSDRVNLVWVYGPDLTSTRTYTISDSGASNGDMFWFFRQGSSGSDLQISVPGFGTSTISGGGGRIFVRKGSGDWVLMAMF
jgi:hypothetical protein